MTNGSRVTVSRSVAIVSGVALLLAGASLGWLFHRPDRQGGRDAVEIHKTAPSSPRERGTEPDVVIPLNKDAADRAGIVVAPVSTEGADATLRVPGVVEPNAYKQVTVTPIAGGRVTRVNVELGDRVRRGQTLAQIYSPELAEAQTRLIAVRAEFEAAERQVTRTRRLVEIGAASRQELEQVHAEHAAHAAALAGARSRLVLLGMAPAAIDQLSAGSDVSASISVPAPIDGTVSERTTNPGMNVEPSTKLFTVVDLRTVWVVGELYERDFARVKAGNQATVTTVAYPESPLTGRVDYIDPQINSQTRTARVRVEVANSGQPLRLGMLAQIDVHAQGAANAITVPRAALQTIGDRQVVYLADSSPGRFIERSVEVGARSGDRVEILTGLKAGDLVVTRGSFFVRAERDRLGLTPSAPPPASNSGATGGTAGVQTARVVVSDQGFDPARVTFKAGAAARLEVVRTTENTCATEIVVPALNVRKPLPLNQVITIDIPAREAGDVTFACGMDMVKGLVVFAS